MLWIWSVSRTLPQRSSPLRINPRRRSLRFQRVPLSPCLWCLWCFNLDVDLCAWSEMAGETGYSFLPQKTVTFAQIKGSVSTRRMLEKNAWTRQLLFEATLVSLRLTATHLFSILWCRKQITVKSDFPDRSKLYRPRLAWPCSDRSLCWSCCTPPFKHRKLFVIYLTV